jgi:GDP-D-mannose dehydratase
MKDLSFVGGDMMDEGSLVAAVDTVQPDEVYNLAAKSDLQHATNEQRYGHLQLAAAW